jgi:hypothetical protein
VHTPLVQESAIPVAMQFTQADPPAPHIVGPGLVWQAEVGVGQQPVPHDAVLQLPPVHCPKMHI